MPEIFYHIAIGRFGAQILGKLCALVCRERLDRHEYHYYLWAGENEKPSEDDALGYGPMPLWTPFDRPKLIWPKWESNASWSQIADHICQQVQSVSPDESLGRFVLWLFTTHSREFFPPNQSPIIHVTIIGTLACPTQRGIILGWLRGMEQLRSQGYPIPQHHLVMGISPASADDESKAIPQRMEEAAASLKELQGFFERAYASSRFVVPTYLIGDMSSRRLGGAPLSRSAQVAIGAYLLLGMSKEFNCDPAQKPAIQPWPFTVKHMGQAAQWGGAQEFGFEYNPNRPFAWVGAYAVIAPFARISYLLAIHYSLDFFNQLAHQKPLGSPDGAQKNYYISLSKKVFGYEPVAATAAEWDGNPHLENFPTREQVAFLKELLDVAGNAIWAELRKIAPSVEEYKGWPSWIQLKQIAGTLAHDEVWRRTVETYGDQRFLNIPLEDWECALGEFETLMEEAFFSRRKQQLDRFGQHFSVAIEKGLVAAWNRLFSEGCCRPNLGLQPHMLAEAVLGIGYADLSRQRDELELQYLQKHESSEGSDLWNAVRRLKQEIINEIHQVPSPVAVYFRVPLILTVCLALALALPLPEVVTMWFFPGWRVVAGLCLGGVVSRWLVQRAHWTKALLQQKLQEWFALYEKAAVVQDELNQHAAALTLLKNALGHLRWLYTNEGAPCSQTDFVGDDRISLSRVLSGYRDQLEATVRVISDWEKRALRDFQTSEVETYLPLWGPDSAKALDEEYRKRMESTSSICDVWATLHAELGKRHGLDLVPFPYARFSAREPGGLPAWLENWGPDPANGSQPSSLLASFVQAIAQHYWLPLLATETLDQRLASLGEQQVYQLAKTMEERSVPTGEVSEIGEIQHCLLLVQSQRTDSLIKRLASRPDPPNELGKGKMDLLLQVTLGVSANGVLAANPYIQRKMRG